MTPVELISALANLGYSVTSRRLTDWRGKGLLPPLQQRGRGRHRGATYDWSEPEILDHAATLYGLLSMNSRTEPALFALWLAGFRVDVSLVRRAWLRSLADQKASLDQFADRTGGMERAHSQWAPKIARAHAGKLGIDREPLTGILLEILSTIFESEYEPSLDLYEADLRLIGAAILRTDIWEMDFINETNLCTATLLLRKTLTHEAVYQLIQSASDAELEQARQHWQSLGRILSPIVRELTPHFLGLGLSTAKRFAIGFGRAAILLSLHLQRSTFGPAFANVVLEIEEFVTQNSELLLLLGEQHSSNMDLWSGPQAASLRHKLSELGDGIVRSIEAFCS